VKTEDKIKLFLVDDDVLFLKLLEIEFRKYGALKVETFKSGEFCIEHLIDKPDMVILDYYLNGVNKNAIDGIQTLDKIKAFDRNIPVIMLSSQDKIEVAVKCMQHGALDYVVKSETTFIRIQNILTSYFRYKKKETY
jgi:two-component system OmpR family response regulator